MLLLVYAYVVSVAAVALALLYRDLVRESSCVLQDLVEMERRVIRADGELGARDARNVLEGRPHGMLPPYREDLHAAHARIAALEWDKARLLKSRNEIRRLADDDIALHEKFRQR